MTGRKKNLELRKHSQEICSLYLNGKTAQDIGLKFGVTYNTIFTVLKEQGVKKRDKFNFKLRESTKDIITLYNSGVNASQIGNKFSVSHKTIISVLEENNIHIRTKEEWLPLKRTYKFNMSCFDDISEESAYWLGMLLTDGYVSKGGVVELALKDNDIKHIEKFKEFLKTDSPVVLKSNDKGYNEGNGNFLAKVSVNSKQLCKTLKQYNVVPKKSHIAECPDLLLLNKDFWRGCVDGDGYISKNAKGKYSIGLYGTKKLCEQFISFVQKFYPEYTATIYKHSTIYGVKFSGNNNCADVCRLLYENSTTHLDRKKEIANHILKNFVRKKDILISSFDKHKVFLKSFKCAKDCSLEYGIKKSTINSAIMRNQLCRSSYYFKQEYI